MPRYCFRNSLNLFWLFHFLADLRTPMKPPYRFCTPLAIGAGREPCVPHGKPPSRREMSSGGCGTAPGAASTPSSSVSRRRSSSLTCSGLAGTAGTAPYQGSPASWRSRGHGAARPAAAHSSQVARGTASPSHSRMQICARDTGVGVGWGLGVPQTLGARASPHFQPLNVLEDAHGKVPAAHQPLPGLIRRGVPSQNPFLVSWRWWRCWGAMAAAQHPSPDRP